MMKNSKVWIVEDNAIDTFLCKAMLEMKIKDLEIETFSECRKAYEVVREKIENNTHIPDIILLDLNMPIWTGWDFIDAFSKIKGSDKVKLYILSSSDSGSDLKKAVDYKLSDHYLIKPLSEEQIERIFQE